MPLVTDFRLETAFQTGIHTLRHPNKVHRAPQKGSKRRCPAQSKNTRASSGLTPEQRLLTQLIIHPHGSVEAFLKEHKGEKSRENDFCRNPWGGNNNGGGGTKSGCVYVRNKDKVTAVIILYNSTQGLPNDLIEGTLNSFGLNWLWATP